VFVRLQKWRIFGLCCVKVNYLIKDSCMLQKMRQLNLAMLDVICGVEMVISRNLGSHSINCNSIFSDKSLSLCENVNV